MFAGAFSRQQWVTACDEPFAGIVGVDGLGQVLGVEQAHLRWAIIDSEFGDRRCSQRGDPAETSTNVDVQFTQHADTRADDHAAITNKHQPIKPEYVTAVRDDVGEHGQISNVAGWTH